MMDLVKESLSFSNLVKLIGLVAAAIIVWMFMSMLQDIHEKLFDLIDAEKPKEIPSELWSQLIQLLSSFEKLAMLAAGTLLGVGVQEANVRTAKKDAVSARKRAAEKDDKIQAARSALARKDQNGAPRSGALKQDPRLEEAEKALSAALII